MIYLLSLLLSLNFTTTPPDTIVAWQGDMTVDLGDILQGEDHVHVFKFKNLTDAPILVENVRAGCGCTATEWENVPVAPGEIGSINVTYDALNVGYFRKYVKVFFHDHRGGHKLWLEGFVEK
jgi:hypothetical protein